jgi:transporter family protein
MIIEEIHKTTAQGASMSWIFYAMLSAFTGALVPVLSKVGIDQVDPVITTTIRTAIMAAVLFCLCFTCKKASVAQMTPIGWAMLILSGIAGGICFYFYFSALHTGPAGQVTALDRLSLVWAVLLSCLFLGEAFTWVSGVGLVMMVAGAWLITTVG